MKTPLQIKHALAENWEDAYVEEKIRDLVRVLNRKSLGLRTVAACEGHSKGLNNPYVYFRCPNHIAGLIAKRLLLMLVRHEGLNFPWALEGGFNEKFEVSFTLYSWKLREIHFDHGYIKRFITYRLQRQKIDDDLALLAKVIEDLLNEFETSSEFEIQDPYDSKNHANDQRKSFLSGLFSKWIRVCAIWTIFDSAVRRYLKPTNRTKNKFCNHKQSPKNTPKHPNSEAKVPQKNTLKNRLSSKNTLLLGVVSLLFWLGFSHFSNAAEWTYSKAQVETVNYVYDGDTFYVNIAGWPSTNIPIRVAGVDTPEIKGLCSSEIELALQARDFTASLLNQSSRVELRNMHLGKYSRVIAEVWIDGRNLATLLIENGLGRAYFGGKRRGWC